MSGISLICVSLLEKTVFDSLLGNYGLPQS